MWFFLTSVLSKVMEKIVYNRNIEILRKGISQFQRGGLRNQSTMDNLFLVQGLIDYYRYIKRDLYIVTVDSGKCFDKLWLEDTINEIYKMDMDVTEINLITEMNSKIKVIFLVEIQIRYK